MDHKKTKRKSILFLPKTI